MFYGHFRAKVVRAKVVMSSYGSVDWHLAEITFQIDKSSRQVMASIGGWRLNNILEAIGVSGDVPSALRECVGKECVLDLEYAENGLQTRVMLVYDIESFGGMVEVDKVI